MTPEHLQELKERIAHAENLGRRHDYYKEAIENFDKERIAKIIIPMRGEEVGVDIFVGETTRFQRVCWSVEEKLGSKLREAFRAILVEHFEQAKKEYEEF